MMSSFRHDRHDYQCGGIALTTVLVLAMFLIPNAVAQTAATDPLDPVPAANGSYFVESYSTNTTANLAADTNAAVSLLAEFYEVWEPGETPADGTILNESFQQATIAYSENATSERTEEQAVQAYLTDRRNQSYSAIDGLGVDAPLFRQLANAGTSITEDIPADSTTVKYSDTGNSNGAWADTDSDLGAVVALVNAVRGANTSSNPAKLAFRYPRPFRWSTDVRVADVLGGVELASDSLTDGGFPSGHTSAGYMASLALAYAVPEHYAELVANASTIGDYRIISGMHSAGDVIGGRTLGTALAAATLSNEENAGVKEQAVADAATALDATDTMTQDEYESLLAVYTERMTYGLPLTDSTDEPAVVPMGAEVLLETRFPYLSRDQRREVLRTTAIESGHVLLDDSEGWGRLNLLAASGGYGSLDGATVVSLDASAPGYEAADTWRNDIHGAGSLELDGTGRLTLSGDNTFSGGVTVNGGTLVADSMTAVGSGDITVDDGVLSETVDEPVEVTGTVALSDAAELNLSVVAGSATPGSPASTATTSAQSPSLTVTGDMAIDGALVVSGDTTVLAEGGSLLLATVTGSVSGAFDSITVEGVDGSFKMIFSNGQLWLVRVSTTIPPSASSSAATSVAVTDPSAPTDNASPNEATSVVSVGTPVSRPQDLARTGTSVLPELAAAAGLVLIGAVLTTRRRWRHRAC
ncbi:hypothetical protein DRB06_01585 [Actinomyces sp. Z5]|uniref:phosphatase PAP2 family protein n=1 Tax=Actinomyces sp. Z5 TaxID=2250216 RepID=UPI000DCD59D6|nr:phosphatase PAP2 family protein [Actinomyces sp. Z5]RAX24108.1 hypothetical protein DRB06_01585 [Actinomyces sp. Z5]